MIASDSFHYNKAKVIQALRYHFIFQKEIKWMVILVNVFSLVSAMLYFGKVISPLAFLVAALLWFLLMLNFWFILPYLVYRKTSLFRSKMNVQFGQDGLAIESEGNRGEWNWTEFIHQMESPHFFHLYFSKRSFFVIPKEGFGPLQQSEIRALLRSKVKAPVS